MPDIAMCASKTCPKRACCHRFTAEPTPHRQSYFIGDLYISMKGDCDSFWSNGSYPSEEAVDKDLFAKYSILLGSGSEFEVSPAEVLEFWMRMSRVAQTMAIEMSIREKENVPSFRTMLICTGVCSC